MMTIKEYFDEREGHGLNVDFLIELYKDVDVVVAPMVLGVGGFATHEKVYINANCPRVDLFYYIALHELAHHKRMVKQGFDLHLNKLSSPEFKEFASHVIQEEIFADRYACLMFYLGNKQEAIFSQGLEDEFKQDQYKELIKREMFGKIEFDLKKYNEMAESLLL